MAMTDLLARLVVPVAEPDDARSTAWGLAKYIDDGDRGREVVLIHVIEKAGGAPDKAGVEQREDIAREAFAAARAELEDRFSVESEIRYGTNVPEAIFAAAREHEASAVAFTPRGGSRIVQLLTGDVARSLVNDTDRPVIALPNRPDGARGESDTEEGDDLRGESNTDRTNADDEGDR